MPHPLASLIERLKKLGYVQDPECPSFWSKPKQQ